MKKLPFRAIVGFLLILLSAGCSPVTKLSEISTLKAVANERKQISAELARRNESFEMMLVMAETDDLKHYRNQEEILNVFGEPIRRALVVDGKEAAAEEWLYRYPTRYFSSPKVVLSFDENRRLVDWQIKEDSKWENQAKNQDQK